MYKIVKNVLIDENVINLNYNVFILTCTSTNTNSPTETENDRGTNQLSCTTVKENTKSLRI